MTDLTHLNALYTRLSNEKSRLAEAKTDQERRLRTVWVQQIQREIYSEYQFLGIQNEVNPDEVEMDLSDDDLLAELGF